MRIFNKGDMVKFVGGPSSTCDYTKILMEQHLKIGRIYTIVDINEFRDGIHYLFKERSTKDFWYPVECFILSRTLFSRRYDLR